MSISVQFNNPLGVFYPGTEVAGVVVLNIESPLKARSVCIFVNGRAHTHWTETEHHTHRNSDGTTTSESRTVTYEATVIYATGEAVVWSDRPGCDRLPAGQHQFPFRFLLPPTCAPSFEGSNGYIRYQVSVEIDRKWKFNKTNRRLFTVAPTFDLNSIPQAMMPVMDTKCKDTGMIFFRNGKVLVEAKIPKMGFVPGEGILVDCTVDNGSSKPIVNAEIKLHQLSRYSAARSGYTCHYSIGMHAGSCTHRRQEDRVVSIGGQLLSIPPKSQSKVQIGVKVPATVASFNTCPIISVEYYLTIKLCTKGSVNSSIKNELPVLIGTVPVQQIIVAQMVPTPSAPSVYPEQPTTSQPPYPSAPTGPQPSLPPPSYEETVFGNGGTTKDVISGEEFAPRYPVYHNLPVPSANGPPAYTPSAPEMTQKS